MGERKGRTMLEEALSPALFRVGVASVSPGAASEKFVHFRSAICGSGVSGYSQSMENQPQCALVLIQSCRLMTLLRFRANDKRGYVTAAVGRIVRIRLIKDNDQ